MSEEVSSTLIQSHLDSLSLNSEEKRKLAEENINIVYFAVNKVSSSVLDEDEKISAAFLGYGKALDTYRKDKGTKFTTYAVKCIKNEISYISKKELRHRKNNESTEKILSVDKNGNNLKLGDTLLDMEDSQNQGLESELITAGINESLKKILNEQLSEREKYILFHRYEMYGYKSKTQSDLAKELDMSQANISKIEKSILKRLRKFVTKEEFTI